MTRGSGRAFEGASSIAEAVSADDNDEDEDDDDEEEDDDAFSERSIDSDGDNLQHSKTSKRQRGSLNQEFQKAHGARQGVPQQSSSRQPH